MLILAGDTIILWAASPVLVEEDTMCWSWLFSMWVHWVISCNVALRKSSCLLWCGREAARKLCASLRAVVGVVSPLNLANGPPIYSKDLASECKGVQFRIGDGPVPNVVYRCPLLVFHVIDEP